MHSETFKALGHTWRVTGVNMTTCQLYIVFKQPVTLDTEKILIFPISSDLRDTLLEDGDFYEEVEVALSLRAREIMLDDTGLLGEMEP